jgi:hypothetical protein
MIKEEDLYLLIKKMYIVCEMAAVDYQDPADIKDNWYKIHEAANKALKCYRETMK